MEGKTLKAVLEEMSPDQVIKIGSGARFFFIGEVQDYLSKMDSYDSGSVARLEGYKKQLAWAEKNLCRLESLADQYTDDPDSKEAKKFRQELRIAKATVTRLTKGVNSDRPFSERKVLNMYESCMVYDEGTICIIIEGIEQGRYWTIDETRGLPAYGIGA